MNPSLRIVSTTKHYDIEILGIDDIYEDFWIFTKDNTQTNRAAFRYNTPTKIFEYNLESNESQQIEDWKEILLSSLFPDIKTALEYSEANAWGNGIPFGVEQDGTKITGFTQLTNEKNGYDWNTEPLKENQDYYIIFIPKEWNKKYK